ncbi:MAG: hypothetical protein ACI9T8_000092 [Candidatus Saccharimonadales bacterium]|jgi:hypothetical protein
MNYWTKQKPDEPLFPDILWSRPESKGGAGKLAVIGGHAHGFGSPGIAYATANESGIGVVKVLLPDAIKKTVKHVLPDADYAPSNPSGGLSKQALMSMMEISTWSDAVILAGDMGRNSETAVLLEQYVQKYQGILAVTHDAADYFKSFPHLLLERPDTLLVVSLAQLQKVFINAPLIIPITYGMTLPQLAEALHVLTEKFPLTVMVKHHDVVFVANAGRVTSTDNTDMPWRIKTATKSVIFWLQNPSTPLESATTSLYQSE